MSSHKIDHKELQQRLKEDELTVYTQEFLKNARQMWEDHGKQIVISVIIVAAAVIGYQFWKTSTLSKFKNSQILFGNAVNFMQQDQVDQALASLNSLIDTYPNTQLANPAKLLRASAYAQKEEYQLALRDYQAILPKMKGIDKITVQIAIAQTQRSMDEPNAALQQLESISQDGLSNEMKYQILYIKGGCHDDQGNNQKALEFYKQIEPGSTWFALAQQRVDWLEAEAVPPIN